MEPAISRNSERKMSNYLNGEESISETGMELGYLLIFFVLMVAGSALDYALFLHTTYTPPSNPNCNCIYAVVPFSDSGVFHLLEIDVLLTVSFLIAWVTWIALRSHEQYDAAKWVVRIYILTVVGGGIYYLSNLIYVYNQAYNPLAPLSPAYWWNRLLGFLQLQTVSSQIVSGEIGGAIAFSLVEIDIAVAVAMFLVSFATLMD